MPGTPPSGPTRTQQLHDEFVRLIRSGHWPVGRTIPTEMSLVEHFGASRTVVRKALKDIEKRGWVKATRGSGRRVTAQIRNWRVSIGLLVTGGELADGQGHRLFTRLEHHVTRHDHVLLTHSCRAQADEENPKWTVDLRHFDGAIVYAPAYLNEPLRTLARHLPVVSMPHDATALGVPSFYVDYGLHACRAVDTLVRLGHRRIGLLLTNWTPRATINSTIRRGFDMGRILSKLPLEEDVIFHYGRQIASAEVQRVLDAFNDPHNPMTALVTHTFSSMRTLAQAAQTQGDGLASRRALICLSDLTDDPGLIGNVAYFRLPLDEITKRTVEALDGMILGRSPDRLSHPFYGELVGADQLPPPQP